MLATPSSSAFTSILHNFVQSEPAYGSSLFRLLTTTTAAAH